MAYTILGIGVDIIAIHRIQNLINKNKKLTFARKIMSKTEFDQWEILDNKSCRKSLRLLAST